MTLAEPIARAYATQQGLFDHDGPTGVSMGGRSSLHRVNAFGPLSENPR